MKLLQNFKLEALDITNLSNPKTVWIEIFKPDREFIIDGDLIEGYIRDNRVLESDQICLRFNWEMKDFIDVEIYGNGHMAWYQLTIPQFNKIKYFIKEIH